MPFLQGPFAGCQERGSVGGGLAAFLPWALLPALLGYMYVWALTGGTAVVIFASGPE